MPKLTFRRVIIAIISFGIICRVAQYLLNWSLWSYEAILVLQIFERTFTELIEPLKEAAAPVGFLFAEKAITNVLGGGEYALRAFPVAAGILAVSFFYCVTKNLLNPKATFFATTLFAISASLCYWSHVVRPYSSDVLVVSLIYMLTIYFEKKSNTANTILFAVVGALLVWLSYSAIFVLAGVGIVLFINSLANRENKKAATLAAISAVWLASFGLLYKLSLGKVSSDSYLQELWSGQNRGFMPFPPLSTDDLKWYAKTFYDMITASLGSDVLITKFMIIPLLAGLFYMWREKRKLFWMLALPIIFTFLASALHKYPYSSRHVLFFAPIMLIFAGYGFEKIIEKVSAWAGVILLCLVLAHPTVKTIKESFIKPKLEENFRAVFNCVKSQHKDEILYVYGGAIYNFEYYAGKTNWAVDYKKGEVQLFGSNQGDVLKNDLAKLSGKNVWMIFGRANPPKYKEIVSSFGRIEKAYEVEGASCFKVQVR